MVTWLQQLLREQHEITVNGSVYYFRTLKLFRFLQAAFPPASLPSQHTHVAPIFFWPLSVNDIEFYLK